MTNLSVLPLQGALEQRPEVLPPVIAALKNVPNEPPAFRGQNPVRLAFGTSGLRGLVNDMTDLEIYINTRGFMRYLEEIGDVSRGDAVSVAGDLRPSTDGAKRSILRAVERAIENAGFEVEHLGRIPTPALTHYALSHQRASVMVTGSHIPFDRNGIKFNKSTGEVLKSDEAGILKNVEQVRLLEYSRAEPHSIFGSDGMFKDGPGTCAAPVQYHARHEYLQRYLDFFPGQPLRGQRVVVYQHSAVGRDLLVELLIRLGAEVIPLARSESFVPIDTEALSQEKLELLQALVDQTRPSGRVDAVISTDGDSDRPLLAGVDVDGAVRFFGGDLLGIVTADFLSADTAVVPISANDAVDYWAAAKGVTIIRSKIGSPFVIEAMHRARSQGSARVVGWEANGGFLTGTEIACHGGNLSALPTRDAVLPVIAALCSAKRRGVSLVSLFADLPRRCGKAALVDNFPAETSRELIRLLRPHDELILEVDYSEPGVRVRHANGDHDLAPADLASELIVLRRTVQSFFHSRNGFDDIHRINFLDGVRIWFRNGDIAHIRPSGNAPQLRIYAVADTQARADALVAAAVAEPEGFLRRMEATVKGGPSGRPLRGVMDKCSVAASHNNPAAEAEFVASVRRNIATAIDLFERGQTPELLAIVAGSRPAQQFWQTVLNDAGESFQARAAISFVEDLPTNQAFGLLLLWQRLKPHVQENRGSLAAFVFGEGTRSTPFTETESAQKPALATFVTDGDLSRPREGGGAEIYPLFNGSFVKLPRAASRPTSTEPRYLSMVELALRHFVPVQQFLRRSGFNGLVVKWGDEVQIPAKDLSSTDALFRDADVVRFVSVREINSDEARNKDWVGVNQAGHVIAFIPRRPLEQMGELAERGLLQRREGKLWGGVNLGSIALSYALLDCLLEEFKWEVNDAGADRSERPALDPEFFTALTIAAMSDPGQRAAAWQAALNESPEVRALAQRFGDVVYRLRRAIGVLEARQGRRIKLVAMNFEDQYWGDIGQHSKIYEFYMSLNQDGRAGEVARAIAGLDLKRDANGNLMVNSAVSSRIRVSNSVLMNVKLTGAGTVENSVLIGTRVRDIDIREGFDVLSTVTDLRIAPGGGAYRVVSTEPVAAGPGERVTTLFLPALGARVFRVREDTDLRDKRRNYAVPILGNPVSFQSAHEQMGSVAAEALRSGREEAEHSVMELL